MPTAVSELPGPTSSMSLEEDQPRPPEGNHNLYCFALRLKDEEFPNLPKLYERIESLAAESPDLLNGLDARSIYLKLLKRRYIYQEVIPTPECAELTEMGQYVIRPHLGYL